MQILKTDFEHLKMLIFYEFVFFTRYLYIGFMYITILINYHKMSLRFENMRFVRVFIEWSEYVLHLYCTF